VTSLHGRTIVPAPGARLAAAQVPAAARRDGAGRFSGFSPSGQLEFNAEFPAEVNTYRAYRLPWFPGGGFSHHG
jgi:hypothetical protein